MKFDRRIALSLLIHIVFTLTLSLYVEVIDDLTVMSRLTLGLSIYTLIVFWLAKIPVLSFDTIFMVCLMIFHFGQPWLHALGMETTDLSGYTDVFASFSEATVITTLRYAVNMVNILTILVLFRNRNEQQQKVQNSVLSTHKVTMLESVLFFSFWTIVIVSNIGRAAMVQAIGYAKGFTFQSNLLYMINEFVLPITCYALLQTAGQRKKERLVLFPLLLNEIIVILFVGNRGESLIRLIIVGLFYFVEIRQMLLTRKTKFIVVLSGVFVILVMPFVSSTRTKLLEVSFVEFIKQQNALVIFLSEFGGTLASTCYAFEAFVGGVASNGTQLLACVLSILPMSSIVMPDISSKLLYAGQMNKIFKIRGLGGSLVGEFIFNFGVSSVGILVLTVLYALTLRGQNKLKNSCRGNAVYKKIFEYMVYFGMLTWVRGSLYDLMNTIKISIYFLVGVYALNYIFFKRRRL